jgi:Zn finger protein HypA/HybF involved in hydrogenase expression
MGSRVFAHCECGLNADILVGRGKSGIVFYYPALCTDCEDVVQVNLEGIASCPECEGYNTISYHEERLKRKNEPSDGSANVNYNLIKGEYYCPKCKNMKLTFSNSGMHWD